ncbi:hypothetical protein [Nostoc sp.]
MSHCSLYSPSPKGDAVRVRASYGGRLPLEEDLSGGFCRSNLSLSY